MVKNHTTRSVPKTTDYVRRRRWIRRRQRAEKAPASHNFLLPPLHPTNKAAKNKSPLIEAHGVETQETAVFADDHEQKEQDDDGVVADNLDVDDDEGEDSGDESDEEDNDDQGDDGDVSDNQESDSINRPSIIPPVRPIKDDSKAATPSLVHFSMEMDKTEIDTAWSAAVNELEHIYTQAKSRQTQNQKKWKVKKEKIRQQIHLMEKTIASMQTFAETEGKEQRRGSASANTSPRRTFLKSPLARGNNRQPLSPDAKRASENASKSPKSSSETSAINLTTKLRNAQSKLDALKRMYWHPRENNYTLRFSVDGIFYGLRDFFIESFKSSFSVHVSHQTNGAQGITPTCKVVLKGHTVCCGKHVKVTGDKGTRVPKSIWDRMYVDTDFEATVYLIYVQGMNEEHSVSGGKWEFLFSPDASRVELNNFTRRVKGGMDLPESVVRKLCSDVLTSLLRDLVLIYFPPEIAIAFEKPPGKLDINGEIVLTGPSIDNVLERDIDFIYPTDQAAASLGLPNIVVAATQILSHSSSDEYMHQIAAVLSLTPSQLNLLVALKDCGLYPQPYSFRSIASICEHYKNFFVQAQQDDEEQVQRSHILWTRLLELLYIRKKRVPAKAGDPPMELFDMKTLLHTIDRLVKKPLAVEITVKRFHCSVNAFQVVEAMSKAYERLVLGIDFSAPRTTTDSNFLYGIRFGRKQKTPAGRADTADGPMLDSKVHIQMDPEFRSRLKQFSRFCRSLKAILEVIKRNLDQVSAEFAGTLKGTGDQCDLKGFFKDVEYSGPVNVALAVPPCFLGMYRIETVAMSNERVGVQIELMLPTTGSKDDNQRLTAASIEPVGQVLLTDFATDIVLDVDGLMEHQRQRSESNANEMTAPWSPSKSFARKVEKDVGSTKLTALTLSFDTSTDKMDLETNDAILRLPAHSTVDLSGASLPFGKISLKAGKFTKMQATANGGEFALHVVPLLDLLVKSYVRPFIANSYPSYQLMYESIEATLLQWLCSPALELSFDMVFKAFIHDKDQLIFTFCGSPLHPTPTTFKDEVALLPIVLELDDLVNRWVDDRYPPYANPLYF